MTDANSHAAFDNPPRRRFWQRAITAIADRIMAGSITLSFADGTTHVATGSRPGPAAELHLANARPLIALVVSGDLGFARAYLDGHWDTPDLGALMALALANEEALGSALSASPLAGKFAWLKHRLRANTKRGSRRNIAYHYDLGNRFYELWLDRTMTYSSALFEAPGMSLEDAQQAKYDRIIGELGISAGDRVLEIGCGWGGFAERAIATTGCHVTGLTLSVEQAAFARDRLARAGLGDKADIRLEDYRDCQGSYDHIVSIEMFEAVGEENWKDYFRVVHDRLKPGGQALVQSITIAEDRFEDYRRNADFIQAFIFPGGMLPTITRFGEDAARAGLSLRDDFGFGRDYAETLRRWDKRFVANWQAIVPLGFDRRFHRMWRYYFHYCATGFDTGRIDVRQFRLARG